MPITPEDRARQNIDKLLTDAGWLVQDKRATNLSEDSEQQQIKLSL
jgi:type I site-specific restriction endonuclease